MAKPKPPVAPTKDAPKKPAPRPASVSPRQPAVPRPAPRPAVDPTDRLPSLPPVGVETVNVRVVSTTDWFDNWVMHREGVEEVLTFAVDEDGEPILSEHVVRSEDYLPPELDLPATSLAKGARVRGGATGMPSL